MLKFYKTMIISGGTGTGISVILRNYIEEVIKEEDNLLIIVDPKCVEFNDYKDKDNVIYVAKDFNEYILNKIKPLIDERITEEESNLKIYIFVDEFAEIKYNVETYNYFKWLIANKRKLNIELILASQRNDVFTKTFKDNANAIINFKHC